ncbi:MAG: primosomal protein N' [Ferrovum sp.]|nr:primosomal protein N' [Ferrovum sp.]
MVSCSSPTATASDVGRRVLVPFGQEEKVGVILAVNASSDHPAEQIKPIRMLWRDVPALSETDLRFLRFCSEYYHHPMGSVVVNALPPGLRRVSGWSPPKRQARTTIPDALPFPVLTADQSDAVTAICAHGTGFRPYLLKGITGSGKTEVYLNAIQHGVQQGMQVLVLTPEINLTPQFELRFRQRLPDVPLISLHSNLGEKARAARWLKAQSGEASVILGTRLAVLCPIPRLGLIVVDEEHDASYKQQEGLRYSARDLAIVRAQMLQIPVVLGSATPALESWWNGQSGRYQLLKLSQRAQPGARLPPILLVAAPPKHSAQSISKPVLQALGQRLERAEQSLVFINRRGYAPVLLCSQCGWVCACSRCSARMVVHLRARHLRCHHCGGQRTIPSHCPECGNTRLESTGDGTQKIEALLREQFPSARIMRVDSDTLSRRDAWADTAAAIHEGAVDIIVGTQIMVKGHDFPKITLVAALNVDGALFSNDFRGSERLFSQLVQVAGRAGRADRPGEVMIQTAFPDHPLFSALLQHDYETFAQRELEQRRLAGFPPFVYQAILRASSENPDHVEAFMAEAVQSAKPLAEGIEIYDPVPAPMARLAGKTRLQLLAQCSHRGRLQAFLTIWQTHLFAMARSRVSWILDVDPLEL